MFGRKILWKCGENSQATDDGIRPHSFSVVPILSPCLRSVKGDEESVAASPRHSAELTSFDMFARSVVPIEPKHRNDSGENLQKQPGFSGF